MKNEQIIEWLKQKRERMTGTKYVNSYTTSLETTLIIKNIVRKVVHASAKH